MNLFCILFVFFYFKKFYFYPLIHEKNQNKKLSMKFKTFVVVISQHIISKYERRKYLVSNIIQTTTKIKKLIYEKKNVINYRVVRKTR